MSHTDTLDGATVCFLNYGTGSALDLAAGNTGNGTPLIGYQYHGGKNQQWKLEQVDHSTVWPTWKLHNVQTGTCADLAGGSSANGTIVHGWEKLDNNKNQLFRFVSADPQGRVVMIQNVGTGTYIDLFNGGSANSTKIIGWEGSPESQNPNQIWRILRMNY
ncbi:carbohydrate-binding module family 13 protein [Xylaria sp. FL1777]|nr:carbohydrate-binding module family 13 protein [Xylaria sp. FL1777]